MANEILVPKKEKKLLEFKAKYPFLFDATTGEQYNISDLEEEEIELLIKDGVIVSETKEQTTPPAQEMQKPEEKKVETNNGAIQKIGEFKFRKMPNTKVELERILKLFSKEETELRNQENDIDSTGKPSMLLNFASSGLFGSANSLYSGLTITTAKGTQSLFVINESISQTDFDTLSKIDLAKVKFNCDEFRLSKNDVELKELNFPTDIEGNTEARAYKCYGVINDTDKNTVFICVGYDEERKQFGIGGKFFNNLSQYN